MGATRLARTLVQTLIGAGVGEVVLAPGSRNAPLALALHSADAAGLLRLRVCLDERSAGFQALGLAIGSGRPAAVVTTSGTASGNLVPAMMEAHAAQVPLVAITADRPGSLHRTGASQTTQQRGLFDRFVVCDASLASTDGTSEQWQFVIGKLLGAAVGNRYRPAGPVHLNVELAAPLIQLDVLDPWPPIEPFTLPTQVPRADPVVIDADGAATVVVAGAMPGGRGSDQAARLAADLGVPLLAEPSSGSRHGDTAITGYRNIEADLFGRVEQVVVVGRPTLSRQVGGLLDQAARVVVIGPELVQPTGRAHAWGLEAAAGRPGPSEWLETWRSAGRAARSRAISQHPRLALAASIHSHLAGQCVIIGSSMAIRDADLVLDGPGLPEVVSNRGVAGIDGTISTAIGVGLARRRPVHVVLGDLTFLHDVSALSMGELEQVPDLRIVVIDDHGGAIFTTLEQGEPAYAGAFERVFGTPQRPDLVQVANGFGVRARACAPEQLSAELQEPPSGIEVLVVRLDR